MHDHGLSTLGFDFAAVMTDRRLVAVTGPRGAPGRTEVALALGSAWAGREAKTAVVDLDLEAPGLALRAGVSPRPDLADAAAALAETGRLPAGTLRPVARTRVVAGSHRPVRPAAARLVAEAVLCTVPVVIVDTGPAGPDDPLLARADRIVVVLEGSPAGIVRATELLSAWHLRRPEVVVNRVRPADRVDVVGAVRRWTGLEPSAVVPERAAVRMTARRTGPPDPSLVRALGGLLARPTPRRLHPCRPGVTAQS